MNKIHDYYDFQIRTYEVNKKFPTNDLVGVEIEYEGIEYICNSYFEIRKIWGTAGDQSLKNNGTEFVLREPLFGEDLDEALNKFSEFITHQETAYGKINVTERCSIHIHINILDLKIKELKSFFYWFIILEPLLFNLFSKKRKENLNCVSMSNSSINKEYHEILNSELLIPEIKKIHENNKFYSSFNLGSINKFGSVEIRIFESTKNMDLVKTYCQLCLAVKLFSKKNLAKKKNIVNFWTDLGVDKIINDLNYGDFKLKNYVDGYDSSQNDLREGLYNLADYLIHPYENKFKEILL